MTSERDAFLTYLLIWNCQSSCCSQAVEVDQVSCTCSCPWPRRRLSNTGQHMQCVFPGVGPYLVSPQSFSWSAATFFQGSKYQAEEQANRGTAEACHFYSSICDPDPSWLPVCVCVCVCFFNHKFHRKNFWHDDAQIDKLIFNPQMFWRVHRMFIAIHMFFLPGKPERWDIFAGKPWNGW